MSYEFTGRSSPGQLAAALQTYGNTGLEESNPVTMPQNKPRTDYGPTDLEKQAVTANLNNAYGYTSGPSWLPQQNAKSWEDFSQQDQDTWLDKWRRENDYNSAIQQQQENNRFDTGDWNDPIGNAAESSAFWADTAYDPNVKTGINNPTYAQTFVNRYDQPAEQKLGSTGNQTGEAERVAQLNDVQNGGMGGNFLGDVDFSGYKPSQPAKVDMSGYAFTGRPADRYIQPDAQVFSPNYANPNAVNTSGPEPDYRGKFGDDYRQAISKVPTWVRDVGGTAATALAGALGGPMAAAGTNKLLTGMGTYNLPNPDNSGWIRAENAARNVIPMFRPIDDAARGLWNFVHPQNQELANSLADKNSGYAFTRGQ
jgi:hypothetical protein